MQPTSENDTNVNQSSIKEETMTDQQSDTNLGVADPMDVDPPLEKEATSPHPDDTSDTVMNDDANNAAASVTAALLPLQEEFCLGNMEAAMQSVFDALHALSQQQQQTQLPQKLSQHTPPPIQPQETEPRPPRVLRELKCDTVQPLKATSSLAASVDSPSPTSADPTTYPGADPNAPPLTPEEKVRQQMVKQKIRDENRTRKRRWRLHNEERNKDNDLRCRVNKRAHKLFGKEKSEKKEEWVQEEFERRRAKRHEKERRKHAVNGALASIEHADTTTSPPAGNSAAAEDSIVQLQQKLVQHYHSVFGLDQDGDKASKNTTNATPSSSTSPSASQPVMDATDPDMATPSLASTTAALLAALQNPQLIQLSQLLAQSLTATTIGLDKPEDEAQDKLAKVEVADQKIEIMAAEIMKHAAAPPTTTDSDPAASSPRSLPLSPAEPTVHSPPPSTLPPPAPPQQETSASPTPDIDSPATAPPLDHPHTTPSPPKGKAPAKKTAQDGSMDAVMTLMELNAGNRS
ncbi:hypothetical protein DM01DRAFT_1096529 [Hesseltinella vesiculosa]|uniref:DUF3020 domain-containing protein n=1 Tax=Hesseltinella vesiculosa TaxID=101127 RepID=A0A1X2GCF5_9FUNG|nr:hypothetical protein DM01DRAFT_1096529 [Hesseltinella vesiculosa]